MPRGFLGVDVFFVISGYLITGIIWRDIANQRFSIVTFYERRIRRLMPALMVVLLVTSVASAIVLLPADLVGYGKSLIASIFFVANMYFWRDTGYFSRIAEEKPLLHLWSLGIEEQFYIFFPLVLFLLARVPRLLRPVIWILTLGSLTLNVVLLQAGGSLPAFYLLPTRAWELGAGALVALHAGSAVSPRYGTAIRGAAVVLIAGGLFYNGPWPETLPIALPVVLGAALLIWVGAPLQTVTGRVLALGGVNFTGQISYSLYLWHWPIVVLLKYRLVRDLTLVEGAGVLLVSFLAATLSWRYVEQPLRTHRTSFGHIALLSTAGAACALVLAGIFIASQGLPGRLNAEAASINRSVGTHYRCPVARMTPFGASRACDLNLDGAGKETAQVVLLGNSHAQMYAPLVERQLRQHGLPGFMVMVNGCLPTVSANTSASCLAAARANLDAISALPQLDTVIVAHNWPLDQPLIDAAGAPAIGTPAQILTDAMRDLIERLPARRVVVVGPLAVPEFDIASTLSRQIAFGVTPRAPTGTPTAPFHAAFAPVFAELPGVPKAELVRPDLVQCTASECAFVRDGISLFSDSHHVAAVALDLFEPVFAPLFAE